jgi:ceramide glucosyltransferase
MGIQASAYWILSKRLKPNTVLPPISILKPLKGADEQLLRNLASIAAQDYPRFEILFGCADANDPALAIARRVQAYFPHAAIRIFVTRRYGAVNPKVSNLIGLIGHARYEYVLISDSNVEVDPSYLRSISAEISSPSVGLVSSVIVGDGDRTIGAAMENLHLNSFVVSTVCGAQLVGHPVAVGKSMLFRRSNLERIGGFRSVRNVLAEDYILGQRFHRAGFSVALSNHAIRTVNRDWTIKRFIARHLRWAQMRRRVAPVPYVAEILLNPIPWLAVALLVTLSRTTARDWVPVLTCSIALKIAADVVLIRMFRSRWPSLRALALIPIKDMLIAGIWAVGFFRRTIVWRGNVMRIASGSAVFPQDGYTRAQRRHRAKRVET